MDQQKSGSTAIVAGAGEGRGADALLSPDAIADAFYQLHIQHRSAWTFELDLRPGVERL